MRSWITARAVKGGACEPNVGLGGNVLLVSMRDILAGEELTLDYAMFLTDPRASPWSAIAGQ